MGQSYIGEIRIFAGNFAPSDWAFCNGALLPISQYDVLYTLIGTTYGGDGLATFALPDLRGRAPVHQGTRPSLSSYSPGQAGGVERVALTVNQMPIHDHALVAAVGSGTTADAHGNVLAASPSSAVYVDGVSPTDALAPTTLAPTGGADAHDNLMPYVAINYIISVIGSIFPSQT
jgi:microcystin-dependent protein